MLGLAALAALFAAVGLRFVPAWVRFWQRDEAAPMSESLFLLLPVPLALAQCTRKRTAGRILTALSVLCSLGYLIAFALRWQVW